MAPLKLGFFRPQLPDARRYSTRPKRGPIEARTNNVPRFFNQLSYSTRPKRGPIEARCVCRRAAGSQGYSTRPKRGPIEAVPNDRARREEFRYSTRPKRGPIEATVIPASNSRMVSRIPRVLSVAPLKRLSHRNVRPVKMVFHAS